MFTAAFRTAVVAMLLVVASCSADRDDQAEQSSVDDPAEQPSDSVPALISSLTTEVFEGDPEDAGLPPVQLDPDGAAIEFGECYYDDVWRFSGSVVLPETAPKASFVMTFGWLTTSDTGPWPDVVRIVEVTKQGNFDITFNARATGMWKKASQTVTGTVFDEICSLNVSQGTVAVTEARSWTGPTSPSVTGPRPVIEGRLAPGPNDPEPVVPDVAGWMTGFQPDTEFVHTDPRHPREPVPGTLGPALITISGEPYEIPAGTVYGDGCGMIYVFANPDGSDGHGAGAKTCMVLLGLLPTGEVEWLHFLSGRFAEWNGDPEWQHTFEADPTVQAPVSAIDDTGVIFRTPATPFRLPYAETAIIDCDDGLGEGEVVPLGLRATATIDTAAGTVVGVACEQIFF